MAKKKVFGKAGEQKADGQQKMAKVVVSTKLGNNKYAFNENMVPQSEARDFIKEKQAS